ncbi:hypothetical protein PIB30_075241 [Stylosanthes scabra]|uniref:Bacterial transcriptional activator domain-containing protein n=1 Tax=Stylosanthes scabra TaxID=79078 RepID=A0ABU6US82_9FABA|nr:hypothetical protein [Stylosanthes scabra]
MAQIMFEPYKNRVYGASGFFAESLRTSGYGGYFSSSASTQAGPASETEVVNLREKSLENHGQVLQQQIDEVLNLKNILDEWDARVEDHLQRTEAIQQQMRALYDPLRRGEALQAVQVLRLHHHWLLVHHHNSQIIFEQKMMTTTRMPRLVFSAFVQLGTLSFIFMSG